jgi:hypothetical protein
MAFLKGFVYGVYRMLLVRRKRNKQRLTEVGGIQVPFKQRSVHITESVQTTQNDKSLKGA